MNQQIANLGVSLVAMQCAYIRSILVALRAAFTNEVSDYSPSFAVFSLTVIAALHYVAPTRGITTRAFSHTNNKNTLIVARKIPFEDPDTLMYVRIAYVSVQVVILGVYFLVGQSVRGSTCTLASCHLLPSRLCANLGLGVDQEEE